MILYIDNREPISNINYINSICEPLFNNNKINFKIEIKPLEIGDYAFYNDNEEPIFIIERKSLNDLESSIKDGRYNEQSCRLDAFNLHNHYIYYLIEGSIINYKNNNFRPTLYSSLFSLNYYKGFSVLNTLNNVETSELIFGFVNKYFKNLATKKSGYYVSSNVSQKQNTKFDLTDEGLVAKEDNNMCFDNYESNIKTSKKANITKNNINIIMLMQIPGLSNITSTIIMNKYLTIENLIKNLRTHPECLDNMKNDETNRKLSKSVISSIKNYLL